MTLDPLSVRLRAIFQAELEDLTGAMSSVLLELEAAPASAEPIASLFRIAHTLKGAAHAAHVPEVAALCHDLESFLASVREGERSLDDDSFALLLQASDTLTAFSQSLKRDEPLDADGTAPLRRALRSDGESAREDPKPGAPPGRVEVNQREQREDPLARRQAQETARVSVPQAPAERRVEQVRIAADRLDALGTTAGELLVATRRVTERPRELAELHDLASRAQGTWCQAAREVRAAARKAELPAQALRALDRFDVELREVRHETERLARAARSESLGLAQLTDEIQRRVLGLRLRPFADACIALPRAVRDLAVAAGKEVRLEVAGAEVQADRGVIDQLQEVLLQLVRNAVDHGIERPEEREGSGKPRAGVIRVEASRQGRRLRVTVSDDGRGPDLGAIRARLAERGLPVSEKQEEIARVLFEPGFSTRASASTVSGRGVGLDVVHQGIASIRGNVQMKWVEGEGTTFLLECPPSLSTVRAVLARAGDDLVAFPSIYVEHLERVRVDEVHRAGGRDAILTETGPVPVVSLTGLLGGVADERSQGARVPVLLLLTGGHRLAVVVDELIVEEEIVVSSLDRLGKLPPLIGGATLLSSGRIALVINVAELVADALHRAGSESALASAFRRHTTRKRVLLADDSFTTRTLEESILQTAGYDVITAADGMEAWELLQNQRFDVLVTDVEMPRMDGFELCEAVRRSAPHARLPVVLVTALETDEDRARGLEAGADAYLPKSTFDQQDLLETIEQLIGQT